MRNLSRLFKRFASLSSSRGTLFPAGHFYSPIVDTSELRARQSSLWPGAHTILGIDFNDAYHGKVLGEYFPQYYGEFAYPLRSDGDNLTFYVENDQFSWLDCRALFVLLRAWQPKRFIEVGSGFSTLLVADVNRRFLGGTMDITCIEPYPRGFLRSKELGIARLLVSKVQDVDPWAFAALGAGDVLFIDSSHVSKTGSDVNHLCFEVLPRLAPGGVIRRGPTMAEEACGWSGPADMSADDRPAVLHITAANGGGVDRYIRDLAANVPRPHYLWHVGSGLNVIEDVAAARFHPLSDSAEEALVETSLARWLKASGIGLTHVHGVDEACRKQLAVLQRIAPMPWIATLHDL